MSREYGTTSLTGGVALLERALNYTAGSVHLVSDAVLTEPTPCDGWDLRALLLHMSDALAALNQATAGHIDLVDPSGASSLPVGRAREPESNNPASALASGTPAARAAPLPPVADLPEASAGQLRAALSGQARRLLGAWTRSFHDQPISVGGVPTTSGIVIAAGAIEVAVHGWDVARACGHDRPIPPSLAEEMLDLAPLFITEEDRPGRFAPPVAVSAMARPSDRLIAFLGRRPG